ncbi:integral membrane protein GPR180-like [Branchiostoma floridae]|uniref:Integral membrane protein GPR180-like n=1 Tax=Branchiostoma floridae TaxID=7739 RepID=A0A9J7M449_BRAFL|nr:integral membrane protein GPR180-like [Branchiostoma floridae]
MLWLLLVLRVLAGVSEGHGKTVRGVLSSERAKEEKGQHLTSFWFYGEPTLIQYKFNATVTSDGRLYLYRDDDWRDAMEKLTCFDKISAARLSFDLVQAESNFTFSSSSAELWHVVYAELSTCQMGSFVGQPNTIQYQLRLFNPDREGNPFDHFSTGERGLLLFHQLVVLAYFILTCIYGPQLWQTICKEGPMYLVLKLLTVATSLQFTAALFNMLHYQRYSKDGEGSPFFLNLSEMLEVLSALVMLYMLLNVAMGWTLAGSKATKLSNLKNNPIVTIVVLGLGAVQAVLALWEQFQSSEHQTYHAHRSAVGLSLVVLRLVLALVFGGAIYQTMAKERSSLRRDFYLSFFKSCLLWFLCYPVIVVIAYLFPGHLRNKIVTSGVVICESLAVVLLYKLFLSRSLYWEVSALSALSLPLRMDRSFNKKSYS